MSVASGSISRMSTLNWRRVREIHLTDKVIPNPNNASHLRDRLSEVRIALDNGFVHIDPRDLREPQLGSEVEVYVVPASSVVTVAYRLPDAPSNMVG